MEDLPKLIIFWKKTPSIRALIHQGFDIPHADQVQRIIKNLPAPERREAKRILTEILFSLEKLCTYLAEEHRSIVDSIFKTDMIRIACLSYHQGSSHGRSK